MVTLSLLKKINKTKMTSTIVLCFTILMLIVASSLYAQTNYEQETKLTASDGVAWDYFGSSVAIDGDIAVVGAPEDGTTPGSAYIYRFNGSGWVQETKLTASDGGYGYGFGTSVAIKGNTIVVGSPYNYEGSAPGKVYIYSFNGSQWLEEQIITNGIDGDYLGQSVDFNGDLILVGASSENAYIGAAYVYGFDGNNWMEEQKLIADDIVDYGDFGISVSINGIRAIIGARGADSEAGAAYIFEYDGNSWVQKQKLNSPSGAMFGSYVSIYKDRAILYARHDSTYIYQLQNGIWQIEKKIPVSGPVYIRENIAIVGNTRDNAYRGAAHIYWFNGTDWLEFKITASDAAASDYLGSSVAFANNTFLVGANGDDDKGTSSGSAYFYDLIARPGQVIASKGEYNNRNKISWVNNTARANGFKIYRDRAVIDSTSSGSRAYYDYNAVPGKIHNYGVSAFNHTNWVRESPIVTEFGWQKPNGKIEGNVQTKYGAGVDSVEIGIQPMGIGLNTCLEFDGNEDFVIINPYKKFPKNAFTISFWIKTEDQGNTHPLSFATSDFTNSFLVANPSNLNIWLSAIESSANTGDTGISVNDGQWHHLAITWQNDGGEINILKDGVIVFTGMLQDGNPLVETGSLVFGQIQSTVSGGFDPNQAFGGLLDEVRIWNHVRAEEDILTDMYKVLKSDDIKLVGYWNFDDQPDRAPENTAGDYSKNGGNHGYISGAVYSESTWDQNIMTNSNGSFSIDNIYYSDSQQFEITPLKGGSMFEPASKIITMNIDAPIQKSVNFIDTTSLTVGGLITYQGTNCPVAGAEINLNNAPTGVFTNSKGEFKLTIERPNVYTIKPSFGDSASMHEFEPSERNLNIQRDRLDINFSDTTQRLLYGKFRGPCNSIIGSADITISAMGNNTGCFKDTIQTDASGNFRIHLPAQHYIIDMIDVTPYDENVTAFTLLQYFSADTVDLSWHDQNKNFTYRTPPVIKITGWPDFGGGNYQVPIMQQADPTGLLIEVYDVWGEDSCHVDEGYITIYDGIADQAFDPVNIQLIDGQAFYMCIPKWPNILRGGNHPYQKLFQVVAKIGEVTVTKEQWAVVTGNRARSRRFYTKSPEQVWFVLHDPPGDQSYSILKRDSTYSKVIRHTGSRDLAYGFWTSLRPGVIWSEGWEVGGIFGSKSWSTDFGIYGIFDLQLGGGQKDDSSDAVLVSFTSSTEIKTSGSDIVTGSDGDVYFGGAFNYIYGLVDQLKYDSHTYQVDLDTVIAIGTDNIESTFIYTESHIRNVLLPELRMLRDYYLKSSEPLKSKEYINSIQGWEDELSMNDSLRNEAVTKENFSYSAGTEYTYSETLGGGVDSTWSHKSKFDLDLRLGLGLVIAGCSYEAGGYVSSHWEWGTEEQVNIDTTETYGYHFADDDLGDFFSVDVKYLQDSRGNNYGAPFFDLKAGVSSNPWEKGTQPRDGVQIGLNKYVQYNVPPGDPAAFILSLGNTSQSNETREYHLSVIQTTNLDGAIIRVGGVVIEDHLSYTIPAGEQLSATLTVERGPIAYDYENLKVKLYAPGDEQAIADTVTFSVHYVSPCSNVNLLLPENNWLINLSHNDTLQYVINNYDKENPHLENIKFQYRRIGDGWGTVFIYQKNDLPKEFIMEYWDISLLPDGDYELRAVSDCGTQGVKYSDIASGVIDRKALIVFGTPEPADGVLNLGEDISISFSGDIDDAYFSTKNNVSLITANDSTEVPVTATVFENTIKISMQTDDLGQFEDQLLIATVKGIKDIHGNNLRQPVSWTFRVNQSAVFWTVPNVDYSVYQGKTDQFTRTLKNAGGTDEPFTIISYPTWLTPNIINGNIPSGGEKEITFTVSTQLNIENYRDTVVVITSFGEERLIVILNVLHQPPLWTVSPATFANNMSITTQISFNDTLSEDIYDIISVYVGNKIRGVANIEHVASVDKYIAFITVYSNEVRGEPLIFRMWDASQGKEYAFLGSDYIFESNSSLGTVSSPLYIKPDANVQVIYLNTGWKWFSLNVYAGDLPLDDALSSLIPTDGDIIKGQDKFSQYHSELGWVGTLEILEVDKSYRINLSNRDTLQYTGIPVNVFQALLSLQPGWNWIAHLNPNILNVNETLSALSSAAGDKIKSQTEFADFVPTTQSWEGSLKWLVPGEGYMLKLNQGGDLQYPVLNKSTISFPEIPAWNVDIHAYEYNMSITAEVEIDEIELRDSTLIIGAFSNYACRGLSRIKYIKELDKYIGFLNVYSNATNNDSVHFKVYQPAQDKIREVKEKVLFISDSHLGNLSVPYLLAAQPVGDELIPKAFYLMQNYPNPFNSKTVIEYGLPRGENVELALYNSLGQRVVVLVKEYQPAYHYKINFDAADFSLASGVYFYQLKAGSIIKRKKLVFIK